MRFPTRIDGRRHVWAHELTHAACGIAVGHLPTRVQVWSGRRGACHFSSPPPAIVVAAPWIALSAWGLGVAEDLTEALSACPSGECAHPLCAALKSEEFMVAVWRAVKRHWRGASLAPTDPLLLQCANVLDPYPKV